MPPLYEYICAKCEHCETLLVRFDDKDLEKRECPKCKNKQFIRNAFPKDATVNIQDGGTPRFHRRRK